MKTRLFIALFVLISTPLLAQQLNIRVHNQLSVVQACHTFEQHFADDGYLEVLPGDPAFYTARKIRKIELLRPDKSLFWMLELDRKGNTVQTGKRGAYYFNVEQELPASNRDIRIRVNNYFDGAILMRTDTIRTTLFFYRQRDSALSFYRTQSSVYYSGALLNGQNAYFNERYLHKKIRQTEGRIGALYRNRNKTRRANKRGHIYLRRRLKTTYDANTLYALRVSTRDADFNAATCIGKEQIPLEQLQKHPFVRQFHSQDHTVCKTKGACFNEPHIYYDTAPCGTAMYEMSQRNRQATYGFTTNSEGLQESYFEHYPAYGSSGRPGVPEEEILLRVRYTYFED